MLVSESSTPPIGRIEPPPFEPEMGFSFLLNYVPVVVRHTRPTRGQFMSHCTIHSVHDGKHKRAHLRQGSKPDWKPASPSNGTLYQDRVIMTTTLFSLPFPSLRFVLSSTCTTDILLLPTAMSSLRTAAVVTARRNCVCYHFC